MQLSFKQNQRGLLFAQLFCGLSSLQKRQAIFGHRNAIDKDDLMLLGYN